MKRAYFIAFLLLGLSAFAIEPAVILEQPLASDKISCIGNQCTLEDNASKTNEVRQSVQYEKITVKIGKTTLSKTAPRISGVGKLDNSSDLLQRVDTDKIKFNGSDLSNIMGRQVIRL